VDGGLLVFDANEDVLHGAGTKRNRNGNYICRSTALKSSQQVSKEKESRLALMQARLGAGDGVRRMCVAGNMC
jgi:hypothetical protein